MDRLYPIMITLLFLIVDFEVGFTQTDVHQKRREQMVKHQLKLRGIKDESVLEAFRKVERHLFVPIKYVNRAYEDRPLPIGEGQTISQPYMVAFMTEILELSREDKVLEIGTGSGYQAAILGELSDHVFTIEIIELLGIKAIKLLRALGYSNVQTKIGDGYIGWEEYAPFDAIIVTCAPSDIPEPLKNQLKEGGRLIIPVGGRLPQKLIFLEKVKGKMIEKAVLSVSFVPMINDSGVKY